MTHWAPLPPQLGTCVSGQALAPCRLWPAASASWLSRGLPHRWGWCGGHRPRGRPCSLSQSCTSLLVGVRWVCTLADAGSVLPASRPPSALAAGSRGVFASWRYPRLVNRLFYHRVYQRFWLYFSYFQLLDCVLLLPFLIYVPGVLGEVVSFY